MPGHEPTSTVIALMARSPAAAAHTIKTRLRDVIPDDARRAGIYRAFLADTLGLARSIEGAEVRIAFTPEGGRAGFDSLGVAENELLPQRGTDLGARERALFEDLFAAGFAHAVVIGSDFPTLPPAILNEAISRLVDDPALVVLGPSADGGYYAIGMSSPAVSGVELPDLFTGVRWSTPDALADTLGRARALQRRVSLLSEWFDVDDADGWSRLVSSVADPDVATRAPHTATAVRRLGVEGGLNGRPHDPAARSTEPRY